MEFVGTSVPCQLCGSQPEQHIVFATKDRKGNPLRTVRCPGCNLVFSNPMPTDEELDRYYAEAYRFDYKGSHKPKARRVLRATELALHHTGYIARHVPPGAKTLDVGSGGGEMVYVLKRLGYDAHGIEPGEGYGRFSRDAYGIDVHVGPFRTYEAKPGSFDLVTCYHVLEHLPRPGEFFDFIAGLLRKGGHLIVQVPNIAKKDGSFRNRFHFAHVHHFSPATMKAFAEKSGFVLFDNLSADDGHSVYMHFTRGKPGSAKALAGAIEPDAEALARRLDEVGRRRAVIGKGWFEMRRARLRRTIREYRLTLGARPEDVAPRVVDHFLARRAGRG